MSGYLLPLLSFLALHSSLALKHLEEPRWKSFYDAESECGNYLFISDESLHRYHHGGYPDELSVRKLVNCVLVNLNAFDEDQQQVKDYVFSRFFVPPTCDCQYKERTQECLDKNVATLNETDTLGRAYQTFQCYFQNYAGISDEMKWVPYRASELEQTYVDCMYMGSFSSNSLLDFCQGRVTSNPDYPSQTYCSFVRLGFYNKTTGLDLEKLYVQYGRVPLLDDHVKLCVAEVTAQYCKEPDRIGNIQQSCLVQYLSDTTNVAAAASSALGNPPECVIPPSPPPKTQPCYNGLCF